MDSMRNLSTSLPPSTRRRPTHPQDLLSDFKAAALSVTNLYKTAAASQDKARSAGYQDAVDDLLAFLDKEGLGAEDGGEGWRIRQWTADRQRATGSDDEDGDGSKDEEGGIETRSSSPEAVRKATVMIPTAVSDLSEDAAMHRRVVSEPPPLQSQQHQQQQSLQLPALDTFTFRSNHAYPDSSATMELDANATRTSSPTPSSTETVRYVSRPNRTRHTNHNRQARQVNLSLGSGAGSKRKIPLPDFFDISGMNFDGSDRRDGSDGRGGGRSGKRGKHV